MANANRIRDLIPRQRAGIVVTALALILSAVVLQASTSPAHAADECEGASAFDLTLSCGHVDAFTVVKDGVGLKLQLQEDVTGHHVRHDPDDVLLQVKESARTTVPADAFAFYPGGGDLYLLPQTQDPELVWPGWSTETLSSTELASPLGIEVQKVDGPGRVFLWQTGSFGSTTSVLTSGGHELPGTIRSAVPAHVHANWGFTEPGRYTFTVRATATRTSAAGGGAVTTEPAEYTFDVGDATDPGPTPTEPTPTPTPTEPTPTPTPTDPTPTPTDPADPAPIVECSDAAGAWKVRNGTVNRCGATVLNDGHVDVASTLEGGSLGTKIKDTTTSTLRWRDPHKTVLQLLPDSRTTVPSGSQWSFLGRNGATFYEVSQTQQKGLLWPGWSTETIDVDETTGPIRWALTDIHGPGEFAIYQTDSFGRPDVLMNTRPGQRKTAFDIPKRSHVHGSWAFSQPGLYCMSMQRVAQVPAGRTVSDRFYLAVAVGSADVMNVDPARCGDVVDTDAIVAPPASAGSSGGGTAPTPADVCTAEGDSGGRTVLPAGHIDYSARVVDGTLQSSVGDDTSGSGRKIHREPSSTILWLKPSSRTRLPNGYGSVGPAGSTVWQVPQTQEPDLIWLGWSTEQLNASNTRGTVQWRLDKVDGPGSVKVYLNGSFGGVQDMVFSGPGSTYTIDLGVHAHANWAFSKEGTYRLTTTQTATLANGRRSSDTETMTIVVGGSRPSGGAGGSASKCAEDTEPISAPQDLAPMAATAGSSSGGTLGEAAASIGPVPLLLGALGGLLLLGAGGTGVLWLRRPALDAAS